MTNELTTKDLFEALAEAGLDDRPTARRIIDATVAVLGERLCADENAALGGCLSPALRAILESATYSSDFDEAELYERIRRRSGVNAGLAREQAQVVIATIGRSAAEEVRRRLERALPTGVAELLRPREPGEPPPFSSRSASNLAGGRPGSRHPISESAPPGAQAHSVVREDNPHGDTKLSSGQPGPTRPIAEGWQD